MHVGPGVSGRFRVGASLRCFGGEIFDLAVVELFVGPYELPFAENELLFVENELVVVPKELFVGAKEERLEVGLLGKLASRGSEWTSARAVSKSCKYKSVNFPEELKELSWSPSPNLRAAEAAARITTAAAPLPCLNINLTNLRELLHKTSISSVSPQRVVEFCKAMLLFLLLKITFCT